MKVRVRKCKSEGHRKRANPHFACSLFLIFPPFLLREHLLLTFEKEWSVLSIVHLFYLKIFSVILRKCQTKAFNSAINRKVQVWMKSKSVSGGPGFCFVLFPCGPAKDIKSLIPWIHLVFLVEVCLNPSALCAARRKTRDSYFKCPAHLQPLVNKSKVNWIP